MASGISRRPLKFESLQETVDAVESLREGEYSMAGKWNLAMICQHLSKTLRISMEGSPFRLPFFMRPVARKILFGSVMKGKQTKLPLIAPKSFQPDENADLDTSVGEYFELVAKIHSPEVVLITHHPVFGRVTVEEWRRFHVWHAAHHLSFLIPKTGTESNAA